MRACIVYRLYYGWMMLMVFDWFCARNASLHGLSMFCCGTRLNPALMLLESTLSCAQNSQNNSWAFCNPLQPPPDARVETLAILSDHMVAEYPYLIPPTILLMSKIPSMFCIMSLQQMLWCLHKNLTLWIVNIVFK